MPRKYGAPRGSAIPKPLPSPERRAAAERDRTLYEPAMRGRPKLPERRGEGKFNAHEKGVAFGMSPRLSENLQPIGSIVGAAPNILLFLDFDGTLVPIVSDPDKACLQRETRLVLETLTRQKRLRMVVISGRSLEDLSARVDLPGVVLAGNHGLEIRGGSMQFLEPAADRMRPILAAQAEVFKRSLCQIPGVQVENKGLTLSIHYRRVPADLRRRVVDRVRHSVRGDDRYRLTEGKKVLEVRPSVDWHKGKAVHWIRSQIACPALPIYIGDDSTDEDAFSALPDGVTIRVGGSVGSLAKYSADSPDEVRRFLQWLAQEISH